MDSFKTLLEKKQYDLVLVLTEKSSTAEELYYRLSALVALSKTNEALDLLLLNRDILFSYKPINTMKTTLELRFILAEFDEAEDDYKDFSNRPYVSQEVEEYLRLIPIIIEKERKDAALAKDFSLEKIDKIIHDPKSDSYSLLALISYLEKSPLEVANSFLVEIVQSDFHPRLRSYAFFVLIAKKYDKEVTLKKNGKSYNLIPKDTMPPFYGEEVKALKKEIDSAVKNPSLSEVANRIADDYLLDIYPESFYQNEDDIYLYAAALLTLGQNYLSSEEDLSFYLKRKGLNVDDVMRKKDEIAEFLNSIPQLSL